MFDKKVLGFMLLFFMVGAMVVSTGVQANPPLWQDVAPSTVRNVGDRMIVPSDYRLVRADVEQLQNALSSAPAVGATAEPMILTLPLPDGKMGRFEVTNAPIMEPGLAARYPQLQTYTAQGIDDPTATARLDMTPLGFHAYIQSAQGDIYIDPYQTNDITHYISYSKANFIKPTGSYKEGEINTLGTPPSQIRQPDRTVGDVKRTYQFVMSASGEYVDFICTQGGDCSDDTAKRTTAMAAIVVGMNRVIQIYERDLAISFTLVNNTDQLVFPNKDTDPYTNGSDADTMLNELPAVVNGVIAINDYDLGHVIGGDGGGGVASTFICDSTDHSDKASGATALGSPIGDPFWVDYTAHEIGHQFNADHSYNASAGDACTTRVDTHAYEPGSGTTIMSYAGICGGQNVQANADAMFNAGAFDQIIAHVESGSGSTCDDETATGNTAPTVEAGNNYTIPKETPFQLVATISDSEQATSALTTSWEQFTLGTAWSLDTMLPNTDQQDNQSRPIVRVHLPSSSPTRTVPALTNILDGTYKNNGEDLPSIDQTLTFRATVRDNAVNGGGSANDTMTMTVEDGAGPFRVTSQATDTTLAVGSTTITWDVANTDQAPVNCTSVDITLSTDGGVTFAATLASSTANDGTETVTVPSTITTTEGRIRVKCSNNIFFDINKGNLTLNGVTLDKFFYLPIMVR